jgi:hypothetical protein
METRTLIDTQYSGDATYDTTHDASNNRAHGAGRPLAISRSALDAARHALGLGDSRD